MGIIHPCGEPLETELVGDAQGETIRMDRRDGRLQHPFLAFGADILVRQAVIEAVEIQGMPHVDLPFQAEAGTQAVQVGITESQEL